MKHEDVDRRRPGVACLPVNRSAVSAKRGNVLTGECRRCLRLVHVAVGIGEEKKKKKNKQESKRMRDERESRRRLRERTVTTERHDSGRCFLVALGHFLRLPLSLLLLVSLANGSFELYVHDFVSVRFTGVEFVAK